MKSYAVRSFLLVLLVSAVGLAGCESQFEPPAALTLQTKSAVEVLPAGARYVGMMNFQALQRNAAFDLFGQEPFSFEKMNDEAGARVQDFLDATGFDPRQDLREIYVAMPAAGPDEKPSLVAYANFDRERLAAYLAENLPDAFETVDYKGVSIHHAREDDHGVAFAVATENMVVAAADVASVEAMLDRLADQGAALKDDAQTMRLIALASSGSSAWFVARDVGQEMLRSEHGGEHGERHGGEHGDAHAADVERDMEQIGQAVRDAAFALTMQQDGAEGTFFLTTREGVAASDVADLTRGVVAAMKASPDVDKDRLQLLDRVRVRSEGDEVRVNFFVDNATLSSLR